MTLFKTWYLLAISFIIISTQQSVAQNEVLFKVKFKPNKTYITEMVNNIQIDINFDIDSAKKKEMESAGMTLPMRMDMLQEMTLSTKTGTLAAEKRIPMTMTYDKVDISMIMNGKEMKQPNQFVGMQIKGYATEDGIVSIGAIEGSLDTATKGSLQKMISEVFRNVEFPNKAMKIGDTFTQEVPMEMPANGTVLNMLTKMTYTLKEIKESQAFFDYTQSVSMNFEIEEGNTTATGSGTGTMIYDIPSNYVTDSTGDMMMNMNMQVGEMAMKMSVKAKTSAKAKVL